MLQGALKQARATPYERTDALSARRNGYKDRSLKTWYGDTTSGDHSFGSSRLRYRSSGAILGWRKLWWMRSLAPYLQGVWRESSRRSLPSWASNTSHPPRSPGWPTISTTRFKYSSCCKQRDIIPHPITFLHVLEGCGNAHDGEISDDPRSLQSRTDYQSDRPEDWV
jgi:hypothetical protein